MDKDSVSNAISLINKASVIAVVFRKDFSGDTLAASLALVSALAGRGKKVEIKTNDHVNHKFSFLPNFNLLRTDKKDEGEVVSFKIKIPIDFLDEFWYEKTDKDVSFFIKARKGSKLKTEDVAAEIQPPDPDLVLAVGEPTLQKKLPAINIDNKSGNAMVAQVNLVDKTSASICEVVFNLLDKLGAINKDAATALLTGIISRTKSFQDIKTTPRSFFVASALINLGADKETVVRYLYKNKTLSVLKLWGRVLARLKTDHARNFVSSVIRYNDFEHAQASFDDIKPVMHELVGLFSDASAVLLLAEREHGEVWGGIYGSSLDLVKLSREIKGAKPDHQMLEFKYENVRLEEMEKEITNLVLNWLRGQG